MIPFIRHSSKGKTRGTERGLVIAGDSGVRTDPKQTLGTFQNDDYVPYPDGSGLYVTAGICQNVQNCTLKRASFTDFDKMILWDEQIQVKAREDAVLLLECSGWPQEAIITLLSVLVSEDAIKKN